MRSIGPIEATVISETLYDAGRWWGFWLRAYQWAADAIDEDLTHVATYSSLEFESMLVSEAA